MDKRLSGKDQNVLLNALEGAKKAARQMEAKEEEKRWSAIEVPLTLGNGLARLTKQDLSTIRSNWNIRGASSLKKQELIAVMEQHASEALHPIWLRFDESRYEIVKHIAGKGGDAFYPLEPFQLDYFHSLGILFTGTYEGNKTLAMPREVVESFRANDDASLRETVRRNTEWIKLAQGLLHYYGVLSVGELYKLIGQHSKAGVDPVLCEEVLQEAESFYREMRVNGNEASDAWVWNPDKIRQEQQARSIVPLYPFTREQLLRAGESGFVERHASYSAFVEFLVKGYDLRREEADACVEESVSIIRNGGTPASVLQALQQSFEMDRLETVQQFMDRIVGLYNDTRQWYLKGHTPEELSTARSGPVPSKHGSSAGIYDFATKKKVGRNDPCPCSSGKKYKKCCGG